MKKGLTLLLMLTLCVGICIFAVSCGDNEDGGTVVPESSYDEYGFGYYSTEDGYVAVSFSAVADASIRINLPSEHKGKPVIGIADGLFKKYSANITGVTLSSNLKYIGSEAFSGCEKLVSVELPSTVVSIGEGAFRGCTSLRSVNIPAGVTVIEPYTFYGCTSLGRAAQGNSSAGKLDIEGSLTHIGTGAFGGCTALSSVKLTDSLAFIGEDAFLGTALTRSENGLVYVDLTDGGAWLVGADASITAADIADGTVGAAVGAVTDLHVETLTVPASLSIIPDGAFYDLSSLSSITVDSANEIYRSESGCLIERSSGALILGCSTSSVPEGVTAIGTGAFRGCTSLESIIIPDNVRSIGAYAFLDCAALGRDGAAVSIGSGVSAIPEGCFSGCSSLESILIPEGVSSIGEGAFSGCSSLVEIAIPDAVDAIEARSFFGCSALESVSVGEGVTSIGAGAFHGCSSLTSVVFSRDDRLTYIGDSAFDSCSSLKTFAMPSSVITLEMCAFRYCTSLTSISLAEGLTAVGKECFKSCTKLSSVKIPASLTEIPASCFENCRALVEITVPEGVMSIGEAAFASCTKLTTVRLPISMVSLVKNDPANKVISAFSGCLALTYIFYGGGSESWYANDLHSGVSDMNSARVYFYSEEQPEGEMEKANGSTMAEPWYWHLVSGVPTVWAEKQ